MSTHPIDDQARRSRQEAAVWFVKLQDPDLPLTFWDRWEEWNQLPENRAAFDAIASVMERMECLPRPDMPGAAELAADRYDASVPIITWLAETASDSTTYETSGGLPNSARSTWGIAAALVALTISVLLAYVWVDVSNSIETKAGEWRTLTLSDGTHVTTGPRTRLVVEFDRHLRSVYLARGEVVFAVVKDAARPFVVRTDVGEARALGTRFAVSNFNRELVVTVAEGLVAVSPQNSRKSDVNSDVQLRAGQQVKISGGETSLVRNVDLELALGWTTRKTIFYGTPLTEAVAEFNRRIDVQILLTGSVADARVFGTFSFEKPEDFAMFLARSMNTWLVVEDHGKVLHVGPPVSGQEPSRARPPHR